MQKLGIIREDATPYNIDQGETVFECDDSKTGEVVLVKKAQEEISKDKNKIQEQE